MRSFCSDVPGMPVAALPAFDLPSRVSETAAPASDRDKNARSPRWRFQGPRVSSGVVAPERPDTVRVNARTPFAASKKHARGSVAELAAAGGRIFFAQSARTRPLLTSRSSRFFQGESRPVATRRSRRRTVNIGDVSAPMVAAAVSSHRRHQRN
jgi:hypothetical protein